MFNFNRGAKLFRISGGRYGGRIVRVKTDQYNDRIDSDDEEDVVDIENEIIKTDPGDFLSLDEFSGSGKKNKKKTIKNFKEFKKYLKTKRSDNSDYEEIRNKVIEFSKRNIILHDGQIQPYFFRQDQKFYVAGPSGSGKSFYCSMICKNYKLAYPDREIYIFSDVTEDPALDRHNPKRFDIYDPSLLKNPIKPGELQNCLVIFDDIDSICDKKVSLMVKSLRDSILTRGRHENVACICTNHILCNRGQTKVMIQEANQITLFPSSGSNIDYLLRNYCGFSKKQVTRLKNLKSRWVTIHCQYPKIVFCRDSAYMPE